MIDRVIDNVESELADNGVYASVTSGTSMQPLFKTNRDMIVIVPPKGELKKYDVVLYKVATGKYVLHRIVKVLPDKYLIRGDNTYKLEHIEKGRILAVLTEFIRKGKKCKVTERSYRLYSRIWNFIYPVRFLYVKSRALLYRIYKIIFKRKKTKLNENR